MREEYADAAWGVLVHLLCFLGGWKVVDLVRGMMP